MNNKVIYSDLYTGNYYIEDIINYLDYTELEFTEFIKKLELLILKETPLEDILIYIDERNIHLPITMLIDLLRNLNL